MGKREKWLFNDLIKQSVEVVFGHYHSLIAKEKRLSICSASESNNHQSTLRMLAVHN